MPSGDSLSEIATRHQIFLERLKTQTANKFVEVLPLIEKEVLSILKDLEVSNMGELTRKQLNDTLRELRVIQTDLLRANETSYLAALKEISEYELGFEVRALNQELEEALGARSIVIPATEASFNKAMRSPLSANGKLMKPFVRNWSDSQMADIDNVLTRAWAEGRTIQQVTQEIRGTRAAKYADGLIRGLKTRQAQAVARTGVQHIASTSRQAVWERNKSIVKKYRYVGTLDGRTTSVCRSLDGQEFEFGKGPVPPVHINCRSTTVAVVAEEFQFLEESAKRAAKGGPVPSKETYYSWLKKQPASFQDEALGPTRGKLFRDGGISSEKFARMQLDKNFRPMTLDQMKTAEPAIFEQAGIT